MNYVWQCRYTYCSRWWRLMENEDINKSQTNPCMRCSDWSCINRMDEGVFWETVKCNNNIHFTDNILERWLPQFPHTNWMLACWSTSAWLKILSLTKLSVPSLFRNRRCSESLSWVAGCVADLWLSSQSSFGIPWPHLFCVSYSCCCLSSAQGQHIKWHALSGAHGLLIQTHIIMSERQSNTHIRHNQGEP